MQNYIIVMTETDTEKVVVRPHITDYKAKILWTAKQNIATPKYYSHM